MARFSWSVRTLFGAATRLTLVVPRLEADCQNHQCDAEDQRVGAKPPRQHKCTDQRDDQQQQAIDVDATPPSTSHHRP
jgi:hypothetical protein